MLKSTFTAPKCIGVAVLIFASVFAQSFGWSHENRPEDRDGAVSKFVAQKLQVWQERMNLKDWKITVHLVPADQLEPKTLGNVHWDTDVKTASISVLSPEDYKMPYDAMLNDMEFTIVHELVHLELASLPRSEASRRVEEHAVNEISSALLRLARQQ